MRSGTTGWCRTIWRCSNTGNTGKLIAFRRVESYRDVPEEIAAELPDREWNVPSDTSQIPRYGHPLAGRPTGTTFANGSVLTRADRRSVPSTLTA